MSEKIKKRIETLKHASAMASDQIHPNMDEEDAILIDAGIVAYEAEIEYLESQLEQK